MPEHRIKFRGGWERLDDESSPGPARKLTLPTRWKDGFGGSVRLIRKFGRPPIDPLTESVRLEFLGVPGLQRAQLNGEDLEPPAGLVDWLVTLDRPLDERNTLILEVGPARVSTGDWGSIALVILKSHAPDFLTSPLPLGEGGRWGRDPAAGPVDDGAE